MAEYVESRPFSGFVDLTDCRVVIKAQDTDEVIFESKVISHDKHYHNIRIGAPRGTKGRDRVTAIVFAEDEVIRYLGTMRRTGMAGVMEIALYAGETKEDRQAKRYTVNLPAIVDGIVFSEQVVDLRTPLSVLVGNISTSGVMVVAQASSFYSDNIIRVKIDTDTMKTMLYGLVVRIRVIDGGMEEYGCRFVDYEIPAEGDSSDE